MPLLDQAAALGKSGAAMLREFEEQEPIGPETHETGARPRSPGRTAWGWLRFLLTLALLGLLLRSLVIAPYNIPSRSMTPTLRVGDYLFAAKWPYGYSRYSFPFSPSFIHGRIGDGRPERGDIVVFRSPADPESDYVKRVIGLPGDTIQLIGGVLFVNGEEASRVRIADYREPVSDAGDCPESLDTVLERDGEALVCRTPRYRETLPGGRAYEVLDAGDTTADSTRVIRVPAGHYFMLGDDRDRSADSRFPAERGGGVGLVPEENIVGLAMVIFWSTDGTASWANPISWFSAARWHRFGTGFR